MLKNIVILNMLAMAVMEAYRFPNIMERRTISRHLEHMSSSNSDKEADSSVEKMMKDARKLREEVEEMLQTPTADPQVDIATKQDSFDFSEFCAKPPKPDESLQFQQNMTAAEMHQENLKKINETKELCDRNC